MAHDTDRVMTGDAAGEEEFLEVDPFADLSDDELDALLDAGDYRADLKKAGFLTRDARVVERKKYGLRKARRRPQFSKR